MDLRTYLKGTTQAAFAAKVGVTQGQIGHWVSGRLRVPADRCRDIVAASGGAIRLHELRPDLWTEEQDRVERQDVEAA